MEAPATKAALRLGQIASHVVSDFSGLHFQPRSGRLDLHLDPLQAVSLPADFATKPAVRLSDEAVQRFLVDGFVAVPADGVPTLHEQVTARTDALAGAEDPSNNLVARIPEIKMAFEHPKVRGALESLLGPGYVMGPHRHAHITQPGSGDGGWHKDCYGAGQWGCDHQLRGPRMALQWLMALYYPHDVGSVDGPTGVQPGRHIFEDISDASPERATEEEHMLTCPGGTIFLTPFDTFHRPSANRGSGRRILLKFHFHRYVQPHETGPTWDFGGLEWLLNTPVQMKDAVTAAQQAVARTTWSWLCGAGGLDLPVAATASSLSATEAPAQSILDSELCSASEPERLIAAHSCAHLTPPASNAAVLPILLARLRAEAVQLAEKLVWDQDDFIEAERPPADLHGTNPTAPAATQALAVMGAPAVPALLELLTDELAPQLVDCCGKGAERNAQPTWVLSVLALDALGLMTGGSHGHTSGVDSTMRSTILRQICSVLLPTACGQPYSADTPPQAPQYLEGDPPLALYWLRRSCAEAIGRLAGGGGAVGQPMKMTEVLVALAPLLEDPHRFVRRSAAIAVGQLATRTSGDSGGLQDNHVPTARVIGSLERMMVRDRDRYNRYYAVIALQRLLHPTVSHASTASNHVEGLDRFVEELVAARLDPVTISGKPP